MQLQCAPGEHGGAAHPGKRIAAGWGVLVPWAAQAEPGCDDAAVHGHDKGTGNATGAPGAPVKLMSVSNVLSGMGGLGVAQVKADGPGCVAAPSNGLLRQQPGVGGRRFRTSRRRNTDYCGDCL